MRMFLFAGLILTLSCNAQYDREAYTDQIREWCPNAEIIEIEFKEEYVEAEYVCQGKRFELAIDNDFNIIFSETDVKIPSDVLEKIDKKLDKKYNGWSEDEFSLIEMGDTAFYKFELVNNGVEQNVYFTLDGKYYRREAISAINDDTFAALAHTKAYRNAPYDFLNPSRIYDLPNQLIEVSGITWADEQTLYCIQDELGAVFVFNLKSEEVEDVIRFTNEGDFEDIAIGKDRVYTLRSDGKVYHFNRHGNREIDTYMLSLDCLDAEGLFLGETEPSLYVACKEASVRGNKNERTVYRFRANMKTDYSEDFIIDVKDINAFIDREYPDAQIGTVEFNPSAFAIHPYTGQRYVLSACDRVLAVYEKNRLAAVYLLPEELYYKPEGMTFSENGDLFLSSEGIKNGPISGQIYLFSSRN